MQIYNISGHKQYENKQNGLHKKQFFCTVDLTKDLIIQPSDVSYDKVKLIFIYLDKIRIVLLMVGIFFTTLMFEI
jgi:hypothetical protein